MARSKNQSWRDVPKSVVALGFVALFMDVSSELVHSLLPLFLVDTLGASLVTVGVIEGVAEGTAAMTKMFSGVISDRIGKRKLLTIVGYGLSAITKPIFPLAGSIAAVFTARFFDRIGKGIPNYAARNSRRCIRFAPGARFDRRRCWPRVGDGPHDSLRR